MESIRGLWEETYDGTAEIAVRGRRGFTVRQLLHARFVTRTAVQYSTAVQQPLPITIHVLLPRLGTTVAVPVQYCGPNLTTDTGECGRQLQ